MNSTNTSAHTAMKWKIDGNAELPLAVIEDDLDGMGICEVTSGNVEHARLIAAAPALYEACKALLPFAHGMSEQLGATPGNIEAVKMARAALALATGKEGV